MVAGRGSIMSLKGLVMKGTEREQGIQAIIALQALVGITEPREEAEANWDLFDEHEKAATMSAYDACVVNATH